MYTERDTFGWGPIYQLVYWAKGRAPFFSDRSLQIHFWFIGAPERTLHIPRACATARYRKMSKHIIRPSVRSPPVPRVAICTSRRRKTSTLWLTLRISQPHNDGANGLLSMERLARLVHAFASVLLHRSRVNNECFDFHLRSGPRKWTKFAKIKKCQFDLFLYPSLKQTREKAQIDF